MIRLDAINRLLVSAQLQPVASLSSPDRLVSKATTILDDTHRRVLSKGWNFNEEYDHELTLSAGNFNVPTTPWTVLALDVRPDQSGGKNIVVRDGKLYNETDGTFTFTQTTIDVDIIWLITFDNLVLDMQEYIVTAAAVRFAVEVSVDPQIAAQLRADQRDAWQQVRSADTKQSSLSYYGRWPVYGIARRWPKLNGGSRW